MTTEIMGSSFEIVPPWFVGDGSCDHQVLWGSADSLQQVQEALPAGWIVSELPVNFHCDGLDFDLPSGVEELRVRISGMAP